MNIKIIIPARYGSTRFPGKPLAMIGNKTMIAHCIHTAQKAVSECGDDITVTTTVATDDDRIADHVRFLQSASVIMTDEACQTGSDRVYQAVQSLDDTPDFVINLQGDAPFTPVSVIANMIKLFQKNPDRSVMTPVIPLTWGMLDQLRDNKNTTPFSGTTAITDKDGKALWFSKNIIPAIRKEHDMRKANTPCPVLQHIGLYGYTPEALKQFCTLPPSPYETLEGLEQLRFIENGIPIHTYTVDDDRALIHSGIDTPHDLERVIKSMTL